MLMNLALLKMESCCFRLHIDNNSGSTLVGVKSVLRYRCKTYMRAIQKVTSGELLTKETMGKKFIMYKKYVHT
jgi:hypothetical protein